MQSATLRLVVERALDDGTLLVQPIVEAWNENEATWRERVAGVTWQNRGGTVGETVLGLVPGEQGVFEVTLPLALVQAWVDAPAQNFGLKFDSTSDNGQGSRFVSREAATASDRPQLVLSVVKP